MILVIMIGELGLLIVVLEVVVLDCLGVGGILIVVRGIGVGLM